MKPAFRLIAKGVQDITGTVASRLLSLEITDKAGVESDRLTVTLDDRDQLLNIPQTGDPLEVFLGYLPGTLVRMGKFFVDETRLEGPDRKMTISANAIDMTSGIKSPKERSFDNITLGDLTNTIAGDNSLIPAIPGTLASHPLTHVDQSESDLQLISRVASEHGATVKVSDGRLVVAERAGGKTASGGDLPRAIISASDCASWSCTITERGRYKSAIAKYQDYLGGEQKEAIAGDGEPSLTLRNSYLDEQEAAQAAKSKLAVSNRGTRKVQISGLIGDPTMGAERLATISGFRDEVDGSDYVVDSVTHSFSDGGYTCSIDLESKGESQ